MKKIVKMVSPFNAEVEMPRAFFVVKKLLAFVLIFFVSTILSEGVVIAAHYLLGYRVLQGEMLSTQAMTLMKYYGYAVFLLVAMLYCRCIEKRSVQSMGFRGSPFAYLKGGLLGIGLLAVSIGAITLTGGISYQGISASIDSPMILAFLGAFIVQGAMEETLCRGFLMTSLSKKVSVPLAVGISSLAFAAPHFSSLFAGELRYSLVGIGNLLLVSTIFSLLMLQEGTIWIACGMHSIWNFCLFNVFGLDLSGTGKKATAIFAFQAEGETLLNGGRYGIEASVLTTVVLALCAGFLLLQYKRGKTRSMAG